MYCVRRWKALPRDSLVLPSVLVKNPLLVRFVFLWGSLNPEWDYDLHLELQLDNYKLNFNAVKNIDVAVRAKS